MTDAFDPAAAAIAAATEAAKTQTAQTAPGVTALPAVQTQGAVATTQPGQAFSMETVGAGQMSVDAWLKVNEFGIRIGDNKSLHQTLKVHLDMRDGQGFMVKQGIKAGNPAQYGYTYDGAVAGDGKSWESTVARMRGIDPKATPYPCVDLPFIMVETVMGRAKDGKPTSDVEIEEGKRLGYTTSTTNWANWKLFYDAVKTAGLMGQVVEVELSSQARTNKHGNEWGVVAFKLVGLAKTDEAAD